jgi:hypothetical protein
MVLTKYRFISKGNEMRILHLEDSPAKYADIRAVLLSCGVKPDDIVWVKNLTDGIFELKEAEKSGNHFDLAITDMYYPVEPGGYEEPDTGYKFVEFVRNERLKLPIVICSSARINDSSVPDCLWYSGLSNWEMELREIVEELK